MADRHCHGARKVEMLAESGVGGTIVAAYGDSASDAAMLDLDRTAVLVNMPEQAAAEMRARLQGPRSVVCARWPRAQEVRAR